MVTELVRGTLPDGRRSAALPHALACGACAKRLAEERALSASLYALASEDTDVAAPPAVEARLLQAFRRQPPVGQAPASAGPRWSNAWRAGTPAWRLGLAAALVFTVAAGGWFIATRNGRATAPPLTARTAPQAAATATQPPETQNQAVPAVAAAGNHAAPARHDVRGTRKPAAMGVPAAAKIDRRGRPGQARMTAVATDFFAVPYAPPLPSGETVSLIRTRVPRSTMVTFGLPLADGRVSDLINADVLVGEDGVTRAIRFVRDDARVVQGGGSVRAVNANATR